MCQFFSFLSNGRGRYYYTDWKLRGKILSGEVEMEPDSHAEIGMHFGIVGEPYDRLNKYEFNPITREFTVDRIYGHDDSKSAEAWVRELDFSEIVPALVIKKIRNPLQGKPKTPTDKHVKDMREWASVRDLVMDSIGDSVGASIIDSVGGSVEHSVGCSIERSIVNSVWISFRNSFRNSFSDSVWASIPESIEISVEDSFEAYISSFFRIKKWEGIDKENPFDSLNRLWNAGFVPSFDDTKWRLHSGKDTKIVFEETARLPRTYGRAI